MEFWCTEVRSGEIVHVNTGIGNMLYLTQATLGTTKLETKKSVCLYITNADGEKFVLGTLHPLRLPLNRFDVLFDKGFEISHNQETGSVYFYGFKTQQFICTHERVLTEDDTDSDEDEDEDFFEDVDEEEGMPPKKQSEKKRPKAAASKTPSANKKAKKTEGKEAGVATPRPSKQAAGGNKSNQKFPASDGAHILKPCKRHTSK